MFVGSTCIQAWKPLSEWFEFIVSKDSDNSKTPFYIQVDPFFQQISYSFDLAIQQGFHCTELKTASDGYKEWDLVHKSDVNCNRHVTVYVYDFIGYRIHSKLAVIQDVSTPTSPPRYSIYQGMSTGTWHWTSCLTGVIQDVSTLTSPPRYSIYQGISTGTWHWTSCLIGET
jgi:hypothetical protein